MRAALEKFGEPVYGLSPAERVTGTLSQYGGRQVSVLYQLGQSDRVEVTTSRYSVGGTAGLMMQLITRMIPTKPQLPWQVSFSDRNVFVPVAGTRTQFHLVEASTGDWIAAGGFRKREVRKRYLLLTGTPGVKAEDLSLVPVGFDLDGAPGGGSRGEEARS